MTRGREGGGGGEKGVLTHLESGCPASSRRAEEKKGKKSLRGVRARGRFAACARVRRAAEESVAGLARARYGRSRSG